MTEEKSSNGKVSDAPMAPIHTQQSDSHLLTTTTTTDAAPTARHGLDSTDSLGTPIHDPKATKHPFSAFYCHPTSRSSLEFHQMGSNPKIELHEHDLEEGRCVKSADNRRSQKPCSVWPGRMPRKSGPTKWTRRIPNPLKRFDKRTRLWIKILIGLLIVAVAIAIGVGISRAVGGGVYKSEDEESGKLGSPP
ncbi:MAG: hypothetical protein M1837_004823 [Sclerophora amabilis]|nr:MAG: hypothetical protein M1837_004823 [Sclerophora amabilis]